MPETKKERIKRLRRERNRRRKLRSNLLNRAEQHARRIKAINAFLRKLLAEGDVPADVNGWHPKAIRTQVQGGIGGYLNVPAKLVWHTTEGTSLPRYSGSHPHFTLDFKRGLLYQHISMNSGAMALKNLTGGIETNRAHAIQVELVGFARESHTWTDEHYRRIAALARFIEKNAGVKRQCSVSFVSAINHVSPSRWYDYAGHIGHQHVPENDHWDPGLLDIKRVLA